MQTVVSGILVVFVGVLQWGRTAGLDPPTFTLGIR